jgi:3',5'-cyclic AMP phosphodiesterase CpdA
MKIAHLSDPHLLDTTGVPPWQLYGNKRFTGMVNLRLKREHKHKPHVVEAMVEDIRAQGVDHVVVTGDLTNLALNPSLSAPERPSTPSACAPPT